MAVYQVNGSIRDGTQSRIATGATAATAPVGPVIENSYLYNFSVVANANDLFLVANLAQPLASAASDTNNNRVSQALVNNLAGSSDPTIARIQSNLGNATSRDSYNEVLESRR